MARRRVPGVRMPWQLRFTTSLARNPLEILSLRRVSPSRVQTGNMGSIVDSDGDGEDWREKAEIGGRQLSWRVRDNRFQLQLVDPGRPVYFVIKFHGRLADHLDPKKPRIRCNYKIMLNA
jgi:hypothetical protein